VFVDDATKKNSAVMRLDLQETSDEYDAGIRQRRIKAEWGIVSRFFI
jgi:hypothetical protein